MRHGHDRAGIIGEKALQPRHRFGVEMVGRLVEQQQVGPLQQQAAQRDAAPLAARERRHVRIARRTAQRVHRDLDRAVELPAVGGLDLLLQIALLGDERVHLVIAHRFAELRAHRLEALEQPLDLGQPLGDVAGHVLGGIERRLLRQVADLDAVRGPRLAGEILVLAGHDA